MKPFRSIVKGYTGQMSIVAYRDHMAFDSKINQQKIEDLQKFIENPFEKTAYQITQFVRGEHFIHFDFLISSAGNNKSKIN